MKTRMNKMLYLKYINDIYQTTDKSYTTEYFDKIKYIINKIPMSTLLTKTAIISSPYTQEYDLGEYGLYYIDFKIKKIIDKLSTGEIKCKEYKNNNFDFKTVYHEFPDFYKKKHNKNLIIR